MAINDEEQYKDVINTLKGLQKVNAPANFETDLLRRINSEKFSSKAVRKESFWERFLIPSRLIPSAALAVAAIIVLFFVNTSSTEQDDPLSLAPRVREDMIISGAGNAGISVDEEMQNIARQNKENLLRKESPNGVDDTDIEEDFTSPSISGFTSTASITRNGLNFRQINLTDKQKKKIAELKEEVRKVLEAIQKEGN